MVKRQNPYKNSFRKKVVNKLTDWFTTPIGSIILSVLLFGIIELFGITNKVEKIFKSQSVESRENTYSIGLLLSEEKSESARICGEKILAKFDLSITNSNSISKTSKEQIPDVYADTGVIINDVRWATRNVDVIGKYAKFVAKPEDAGGFFQWYRLGVRAPKRNHGGILVDFGYDISSHWYDNMDPSPAGWRIPTNDEIGRLLDESKVASEWIIINGVKGRKFTDKSSGNYIFLPAAGHSNPNIRTHGDVGSSGHYWSGTSTTGNSMYFSYSMFFHRDNVFISNSHKGNGFSIRSVSKSLVSLNKRTYKPDLHILSLKANSTLYHNRQASFTATLKNNGNETYNSRLWFYIEKPDTYKPWQRFGTGEIFSIAPGETKTIIINHIITLPSDTYNCNMVFDANNNPSDMDTYQFSNINNPLGVQVTIQPTPMATNQEEYVIINGIKWATCNVDAPGTFADTPESIGMFYQRNIKVGWSVTDPKINTDGGTDWIYSSGGTMSTSWDSANDPCPTGYRLPTMAELKSLIDSGSIWTSKNGVNGRRFGNGANQIFLPASGSRDDKNGALRYYGSSGYIWSSNYSRGNGYYLRFDHRDVQPSGSNSAGIWAYGFPCRCVKEE
jgi:uncharacterized protein (TIGR02145 family)